MGGDDAGRRCADGSAVLLPELRGAGAEGPSFAPLRTIVDQALTGLSAASNELYSDIGRPSVPPEKLLRALLLQAFYSVRSARQLMEQLDYHLLFRGVVGLARDAPIWAPTVFTRNRDRLLERATLGAAKAYAVANFVADLRALNVTPHVAQNTPGRGSAIDGRTTRQPGSAASQRPRKRIEEAFGWIETVGGLRKTRQRGIERIGWMVTLTAAACNLVRLPKLLQAG